MLRIVRVVGPTMVGVALSFVLTAPVLAVKPIGACPNSDFDDMTLQEVIHLLETRGAPPEEIGGAPFIFDAIDANDDGLVCVKLTARPGTAVNAVDNTSHSN